MLAHGMEGKLPIAEEHVLNAGAQDDEREAAKRSSGAVQRRKERQRVRDIVRGRRGEKADVFQVIGSEKDEDPSIAHARNENQELFISTLSRGLKWGRAACAVMIGERRTVAGERVFIPVAALVVRSKALSASLGFSFRSLQFLYVYEAVYVHSVLGCTAPPNPSAGIWWTKASCFCG